MSDARLIAAALLLTITADVPAQVAITSVNLGTPSNAANVSADKLYFLNEVPTLQSVAAGAAGDYVFSGAVASAVSFRRNTSAGNANTANVYYQYSSASYYSGTLTVLGKGDSTPTLSEVLLSSDLTQGLRNPFANGSSNSESNIERIDFYFAGGLTVQADDAVVFFDLENVGDYGDGFRISAFTSVGTVNGTANAPTTYANSGLLIQPDSLGTQFSPTPGLNGLYAYSSTSNGNNFSSGQSFTTIDSNSGSTYGSNDLLLAGILIRFSDLGLTSGQTIYGYSIMAGDVAATGGSQLVNWNDASVFLTDTDAATWGNADFAGFGAQVARPVPEARTYGVLLLSTTLLGLGLRRWRGFLRRYSGPARLL